MDPRSADGNFNSHSEAAASATDRNTKMALEFMKSDRFGSTICTNEGIRMIRLSEALYQTGTTTPFFDHLPRDARGIFQRRESTGGDQGTSSSPNGTQRKNSSNDKELGHTNLPSGDTKVHTWLIHEDYRSKVRVDLLKRPSISSHCKFRVSQKKVHIKPIALKLPNVIYKDKSPNSVDLEVGNVKFRVFDDGTLSCSSAGGLTELVKTGGVCLRRLKKAGYFEGIETSFEGLKRDCVKALELNANVLVTADLPWSYDFHQFMEDINSTDELRKIFAFDPEYSATMSFSLKCDGKSVSGHLKQTGAIRIKSAKTVEMAREAFVRISLITSRYRC